MVSDVWNLINNFLTKLNLSYFLIFIVNQLNKFIGIDTHGEIIDVETGIVLFEVNLVITSRQISHQITESITIIEEF